MSSVSRCPRCDGPLIDTPVCLDCVRADRYPGARSTVQHQRRVRTRRILLSLGFASELVDKLILHVRAYVIDGARFGNQWRGWKVEELQVRVQGVPLPSVPAHDEDGMLVLYHRAFCDDWPAYVEERWRWWDDTYDYAKVSIGPRLTADDLKHERQAFQLLGIVKINRPGRPQLTDEEIRAIAERASELRKRHTSYEHVARSMCMGRSNLMAILARHRALEQSRRSSSGGNSPD